jgi:hypothetical protein
MCAVARYLGRSEGRTPRRAGAYAASALLAIGLVGGAGVPAWDGASPARIRAELAEAGILAQSSRNGIAARAVQKLDDGGLAKLGPLLASLGDVWALDLSQTQVASLQPLKALTTLQSLDLSGTEVANLEALSGLTALQKLSLSATRVASLEPLEGLTALQSLDLSSTRVASLEGLQGLTALRSLGLSATLVAKLEALKGLAALRSLDLSLTHVDSLELAVNWLSVDFDLNAVIEGGGDLVEMVDVGRQ